MFTLPGYQIKQELYSSSNSVVYRAVRDADGRAVILKVLNKDYPDPTELARFQREYELLQMLSALHRVSQTLGMERYQNSRVIVLEDIGADALPVHMRERPFSVEAVLRIALQVTLAVAELHQQQVIHKDINPSNIILNGETGALELIDFGISTLLSQEKPLLRNPDVMEGTLAYMSPEQTGRMNRAIDYRTDFYSIGVTLYELLTTRLPFEAQAPLELVHAHLAKTPPPPVSLNPEIPQPLSDIVLKLLAKTAEERYQSAYGLKADLERVLRELQAGGAVASFALGEHDLSHIFQLPQTLYGREAEIATLLAAFARVSQGATELMLVSGYSGIGKSALIHEIHRPLVRQRGFFITGKFDQFQRNIPYASIIEAFRDLIRQLLTESNSQIAHWREALLAALGSNGQIIVDVLPQLEVIIGKQPAVPELGPQEAQNRFNLLFRHFIGVFARAEHPLVLFLDDLQWADSASLNLIKNLLTDPGSHHLFMIGAYRDNEVTPAHPLMLTLEEMKKVGVPVSEITLRPLGLPHVTQLVMDTLHCEDESARPLADLVLERTAGNPFFIDQLLLSLHQEEALTFDGTQGCWRWEMERVRGVASTDNVIEMMAGKIQKLAPPTQEALKLAACIGNRFDSQSLASIAGKSQREIAVLLWEALREGLILPLEEGYKLLQNYAEEPSEKAREGLVVPYRFLHDRVQQAAYSLLTEEEKERLHLRIGRLLLEQSEATLFDIVNHLNSGARLVEGSARIELARLNQAAGLKAKGAAAFDAAARYMALGVGYLPADRWARHYELTLALHKEWAECEWLCGNFEQAERLIELMLAQVQSPLEKATVYQMRVVVYNAQGRPAEALSVGVDGLALLDIVMPLHPAPEALEAEAALVEQHLGTRAVPDLIDAPPMTDAAMLIATSLLMNMNPPAYQTNPPLWSLICLKMLNLSLQYGNTPTSPYAYAMQGLNLATKMAYHPAYEYGRLAVELIEKTNNLALQGSTYFIFAHTINHWSRPFASCEPLFEKSLQALLETGDFVYLSYFVAMNMRLRLAQGVPLHDLYEEITRRFEWVAATNYDFSMALCRANHQLLKGLMGLTKGWDTLDSEDYREADYVAVVGEIPVARAHLAVHRLQLLYLHEQYAAAHEAAREASRYFNTPGMVEVADQAFYHALTLTALWAEAAEAERVAYGELLERYQQHYEEWAACCPENFLNRALLIQAEVARIRGQGQEAEALYDRAIEVAHDSALYHMEALANELAARFYVARGKEKIARSYLIDARYGYVRWGATPKVKLLDTRYGHLLPLSIGHLSGVSPLTTAYPITTSSVGHTHLLDLSTVMRASQAISSEIELDRLLKQLMRIVIENAGAQRGVLLLEKEGQLVIEAEGDIDQEEVALLQSAALEQSSSLPAAIIHLAARTQAEVILNDATREGLFTSDPYIIARQVYSVLCTPLLHQSQLIGVLYLENGLTPGAFTPERVELVRLLGTQAAISITNARAIAALAEQERIRMEKVLLEQRARDLTELNASKDKFFSIISHDMRTPFNSLLGLAQLMDMYAESFSPAELKDFARRIYASGKNMLSLLDNLIHWSRMQAGRLAFQPEIVELGGLVRRNVDLFSSTADFKEITLSSDLTEPTLVYIDPNMIDTVIRNLLSNAIKFTDRQGQVRLSAKTREEMVEVMVSDTGIGISEEDSSKLFRLDISHSTLGTEQEGGSGLGLLLCKELVEKNGGQLRVESVQGEGSTFSFTVPVAGPDQK